MAHAATAPDDSALLLRQGDVETGPWHGLVMDLRELSPNGLEIDWSRSGTRDERPFITLVGVKPEASASESAVYPPPYGISDAILIELGSQRGYWVRKDEIMRTYRITSEQLVDAVGRIRRRVHGVKIEQRTNFAYRLTGPLPPHVERIAPR